MIVNRYIDEPESEIEILQPVLKAVITTEKIKPMNTFLTSVWTWIKANLVLSIVIGLGVLLIFFPKVLKGLFGHTRRVRHHRRVIPYIRHRRHLPRSVGVPGSHRRHTPGTKRPWQIKGSLAARRHMAQIRRLR